TRSQGARLEARGPQQVEVRYPVGKRNEMDARKRIEAMLEDGRITSEEAERLLSVLDDVDQVSEEVDEVGRAAEAASAAPFQDPPPAPAASAAPPAPPEPQP